MVYFTKCLLLPYEHTDALFPYAGLGCQILSPWAAWDGSLGIVASKPALLLTTAGSLPQWSGGDRRCLSWIFLLFYDRVFGQHSLACSCRQCKRFGCYRCRTNRYHDTKWQKGNGNYCLDSRSVLLFSLQTVPTLHTTILKPAFGIELKK